MNSNCQSCKLCKKSAHRNIEEKEKLIKRLNIIEGQVRGLIGMLQEDRYCDDILVQISAVRNSLKSIGNELLESHLNGCILSDIKDNNTDAIKDVFRLFEKLNK